MADVAVRPIERAPAALSHEARSRRSATGERMVVTAFPAATDAGLEILRSGGNAVDAAVAAAWALSVCEPSGSGLGGQTTMLIRFGDGRTVVLDGHSSAPRGVSPKTVGRRQQRYGYRATTIPSTPATLGAASARYGRLPLREQMRPAIRLAGDGFAVGTLLNRHLRWCRSVLQQCPWAVELFFDGGRPLGVGRLLRQERLARTLERLAARGTDDFYRGEIARKIAAHMREVGGLLAPHDLAEARLPVEREPLSVSYRGRRLLTVPPPGGGLQLAQGLMILERLLPTPPVDAAVWYRAMARVTERVFLERDRAPLDPDDDSPSILRRLLSAGRAEALASALRSEATLPGRHTSEEPGETTHLCTADAGGTVVSLTQSIQSLFGAKVGHPELGFFYNNYLCTCPRRRHPNRLGSGARPRSNVAPTLVFPNAERGRPVLVLGAAGSRRITSALLQVVGACLDRGMSLPSAIDSPRIHGTASGKVWVERPLASERLSRELSTRYHVVVKSEHSYAMGAVQAMERRGTRWTGAADPRREGVADGE